MSKVTLTALQDRLGIKISGEFVEKELGVAPVEREKRAVFWSEEQVPQICDALIKHVHAVKTGTKVVTPKPKKVKEDATAAGAAVGATDASLDDMFR